MMKKYLSALPILFLLFTCKPAVAQEITWPQSTRTVSAYFSTLFVASPLNLSLEKMYHKGGIHLGYTTGVTVTFYEIADYASFGGHLTFTAMTGKKNHHLEAKAGLALLPFLIYQTYEWTDYYWLVNPVLTLGYRYEKPDGKGFYRIGFGTGGFGMGFGIRLD